MKFNDLHLVSDWLYLSVDNLALAFPLESKHNLRVRLHAWEKSGNIISVMRNVYINPESVWFKADQEAYLKVVACTVKSPSYVSLDTVLSHYGVFTEARYGLTLCTRKSRSLHQAKLISLKYQQLSESIFGGYNIVDFGPWQYYEATKAKALFDWVYLRIRNLPQNSDLDRYLEEWRLNLATYNRRDWRTIDHWVKRTHYQSKLSLVFNKLALCTP